LVLNAREINTTQTILIVIEDVTERKRAQEELERNESTSVPYWIPPLSPSSL